VEEIATYIDLVSKDSWMELITSIEQTLQTFNELMQNECDLLLNIATHAEDEVNNSSILSNAYHVHLDISEIINAEKHVDELSNKLQSLQVSIPYPSGLPYIPYVATSQQPGQNNPGNDLLNSAIKVGLNTVTDFAFDYKGGNLAKRLVKIFGKNVITEATNYVVDSGLAIMEESGILSLVSTFGEELIGVGIATSETGVGLFPLIAGAVLTGGAALYSHFAGKKEIAKPSTGEPYEYVSSQQEVLTGVENAKKHADFGSDNIIGQDHQIPISNVPINEHRYAGQKSFYYAPLTISATPVSKEERKKREDDAVADHLLHVRYAGPRGGGSIIINMNKSLIEHFDIHVKGMKESYPVIKQEVERALHEIFAAH